MQFSLDEINEHREELRREIKQIEKEIQNNPNTYSETIIINNLRYILNNLEDK